MHGKELGGIIAVIRSCHFGRDTTSRVQVKVKRGNNLPSRMTMSMVHPRSDRSDRLNYLSSTYTYTYTYTRCSVGVGVGVVKPDSFHTFQRGYTAV